MTDFKPGQLAKATVRGVPDVTVFRTDSPLYPWEVATVVVDGLRRFADGEVTDVRPLVVLDLAPDVYPLIAGTLRKTGFHYDTKAADQIERQTRPAIEEPGLWGVVEATHTRVPRRRWVHHEEDRWVADDGTVTYWPELKDVEVIRPGVEQ